MKNSPIFNGKGVKDLYIIQNIVILENMLIEFILIYEHFHENFSFIIKKKKKRIKKLWMHMNNIFLLFHHSNTPETCRTIKFL